MRLTIALRRLALVATTSSILLTGLPVGTAYADGAITDFSPIAAANDGPKTIRIYTADAYVPAPAPGPTVTFKRHANPTESKAGTSTAAGSDANGSYVDATVDLTRVNPGDWDVTVSGNTLAPAADVVDSCTSCFTVTSFAPAVTAVSAATAGGASNTVGGGATGLTFTITGSHFTNSVYCSIAPCSPLPTVTVSGTGVNLGGSGAGGAETAATATTITKKITVDAGAAPGPRDVTVTNTDGKSGVCTGCLVVGQTPTLTAVTPNELGQGATNRTLVLTGTNFATGAAVTFALIGSASAPGVTVNSTTVNSPTQITLNVTVSGTAPVSFREVKVTNPNSGTVMRADLFDVRAIPTVSSVTYNSSNAVGYGQGAQSRTFTITGTGFQTGATVAFAATNGMTINATTVDSPTQITLGVSLAQAGASDAPTVTTHTITVTNPDGGVSGAPAQSFTVRTGPTITGVDPPSRAVGTTSTITIAGTRFDAAGVTVTVPGATVNGTPTVNNVTSGFGTSITLSVTTTSAVGPKNITVLNAGDKGQVTCSACFSIDNLQTDSISPTIAQNDGNQVVTITGAGFAADAVPTLVKKGTGAGSVADIVGTNVTVNGAGTQITATFPLAAAAPGGYTPRVTNPTTDAGVGTCTCTFTVTSPQPQVTLVSPPSRGEGATNQPLVITGSGFAQGATITFSNSLVSIVGTPVITATQISLVVNVGSGAYAEDQTVTEKRGVTITNTDAQSSGTTGDGTFAINKPPTASSLSAGSRALGTTKTGVTFTGADLTSDATLLIGGTGVSATVTQFQDNVPDENSLPTTDDVLTVTLTVAPDALLGSRSVTVLNGDGGRATCSCTLTVTAQPTIGTVAPVKLKRGATTSVTITGTGFRAGAAVLPGAGVTSGTVVVNSATTITVPLTVAVGATLGDRDLTVDNGDGGTATKLTAYEVITVPDAPTAVSAVGGAAKATVSWTAPATDGGDPITSYKVTASPGGAFATVDFPATTTDVTGLTNGTSYTFTVVATNLAGNSAPSAASNAVTPLSVPDAPTGVTATDGNAQATVSWTAPAATGGSALTGYTVTSSPGGVTKTVSGSTVSTAVTGLTNGTEYTFTVVATNAQGSSVPSTASNAVTPATVPDAPITVDASPSDQSAFVTWGAPGSNGGSVITGYTVTSSPEGHTAAVDGSTLQASVPGLTNGTAYTFTVTATNAKGTGAPSGASPSVTPAAIPGAPTNVAASPGNGQAHVTWDAPASTGGVPLSTYTVTASPGGATKTVNGDITATDVTGLTNGTSYTFTVVATNTTGDSVPSGASGSVTPFGPAAAPTDAAATAGNATAHVTWTASASNNGSPITGYVVTSSPGSFSTSVNSSTFAADVPGLTNGTSYTFTVIATNGAGNSAPSAPSNAVVPATVPGAPTAVTATAGHAEAAVSWTAPAPNGRPITGYTVTSSPGGITKPVTGTSTTMTGLTNGTSYTFAVTATNAIGTGAAGTSNAVTPTWVTALTESATAKVTSGGTATVSGKLTRTADNVAVAGKSVGIYAKTAPATTYTLVRTLTTTASGAYTTTFTVKKNTKFQAKFLGASGFQASTSPIRTTLAAYKVTTTWSVSGRTVTVTGGVAPSAAGRTIYLYLRRSDGSFASIAAARISGSSTYRLTRTLGPGYYVLAVHIGASSTNVATTTKLRATRIS